MKSDTAAHEKRFVASKGCCASFAYEGEDKDEGDDEAENDDEYGDDYAVDTSGCTCAGTTMQGALTIGSCTLVYTSIYS